MNKTSYYQDQQNLERERRRELLIKFIHLILHKGNPHVKELKYSWKIERKRTQLIFKEDNHPERLVVNFTTQNGKFYFAVELCNAKGRVVNFLTRTEYTLDVSSPENYITKMATDISRFLLSYLARIVDSQLDPD